MGYCSEKRNFLCCECFEVNKHPDRMVASFTSAVRRVSLVINRLRYYQMEEVRLTRMRTPNANLCHTFLSNQSNSLSYQHV